MLENVRSEASLLVVALVLVLELMDGDAPLPVPLHLSLSPVLVSNLLPLVVVAVWARLPTVFIAMDHDVIVGSVLFA